MKIKNMGKRLASVFILMILMLIMFIIIKKDDTTVTDTKGNPIQVKVLNRHWEFDGTPFLETMYALEREIEHMRALNGPWEICEVSLSEINVLEYMKDGMENPVLLEYYQEGIQDVYDMTISKQIAIRYYDVDLNDDGQNEYLVIVQSSLHSGALGDTFDILLNAEDAHIVRNDFMYTFPLLGYDCEPIGELFVLNSSTNGYRDLEVICKDAHFYLVYSGKYYVYVTSDEWAQKTEEYSKETLSDRSYLSFQEFPYEHIEYVSQDTYDYIKSTYQKIQWVNEFYPGDGEYEDLYKMKYKQLLDCEIPIETEDGTIFINEYLAIYKDYYPKEIFDGKETGGNYGLYFFDADADGKQELCVKEMPGRQVSIFKYIPESDTVILWTWYWASNGHLMGSRILGANWQSQELGWYLLDENGKTEIEIQFFNGFFYNHGEDFYMVSIPVYSGKNETVIPDSVIREGYYNEAYDCTCYHVTEQQYQELTGVFYKEYATTENKLKEMTYSYEELFGE